MRTVIVRYKTKPAEAETNAALVRAVFAELKALEPGGLRYTTYREADGVSFVHLATVETPADNPLTTLPAFKEFQREIKARCAEPPVVTEVQCVGTYGRLE
jgi:quinol monooxygenase YgiN